jgi:hypothetical protein
VLTSAFQVVDDYESQRSGRVADDMLGVTVLTRSQPAGFDVVASPSAAYLVPDLLGFSLATREGGEIGHQQYKLLDRGVIYCVVGAVDRLAQADPYAGWRQETPFAAGEAAVPVVDPPEGASRLQALLGEPSIDSAREAQELPVDAPVAAIATRVAQISGLDDARLARLFGVERETFCRWRTGALANPRVGNRRRLGLLLRLLEDLRARDVNVNSWLLNRAAVDELTPYDLLARGRIGEVAQLAVAIGADVVETDDRRVSVREATDQGLLVFDDDDQWTVVNVEGEPHDR